MRLSVKEAAESMGVSQQFIRVGLQRNQLPFGVAVKLSSRWTYYINPGQFREFMGEVKRGERYASSTQAETQETQAQE